MLYAVADRMLCLNRAHCAETDLHLSIVDRTEQEIISYQPKAHAKGEVPPPATELIAPPAMAQRASTPSVRSNKGKRSG